MRQHETPLSCIQSQAVAQPAEVWCVIEAPGSNPPKVETRHATPGGKAPLWNDEFVVELSPSTTELVLTVCGQSMYDGHTMREVIGSGANFGMLHAAALHGLQQR